MAGARFCPATASSLFCLLPRHGALRAFAQLPRIPQRSLPRSYSRACGSSQFRTGRLWRQRAVLADAKKCAFGASAGRCAGAEGGERVVRQREDKATTPSTTSALTPKPKLPLVARYENIYNLPNILTFSRLLATPLIGYLIIHDQHLYAFALFAYAGFSDLLDGWIARKWHLQTVVGSVVDPMADKALMTTLVGCLAVNGALPLPLAALILGRDASLALAALYFRYASLPRPKTFARYWDFSLPSAEVHPTTVSKLNTFLQLLLIGTTMCVSLLHDAAATASAAGGLLLAVQELLGGPEGVARLVAGGQVVVAATTVWSGLEYAVKREAVKILGDDEALKKKQGVRGRMIIGTTFGSVAALALWLWVTQKGRKKEEEEEGGEDETAV